MQGIPNSDNDGSSSPFDDFIEGLDFSALDDSKSLENRKMAIILARLREFKNVPPVNPLTNKPWEGDLDDGAILILGIWPEIDGNKIRSTMEDGSISYEHFKIILAYWREKQAPNIKISETQIKIWFEQRTTQRYPWRFLKEFLLENDIIFIPDDYSSDTAASMSESTSVSFSGEAATFLDNVVAQNRSSFDENTKVIEARKAFMNEIVGFTFNAQQMSNLIFKHFKFAGNGMAGLSRSAAMLSASDFIRISEVTKRLGSNHTNMFLKYVQDLLDNLCLSEI